MTKISKLRSVDSVPSHHSGAQGRDFAGASVPEVAARLRLLVGGAPGCGRARPALGGLLAVVLEHAGEAASAWLCDCRRWPLALVCLWAPGFGGAGLWGRPSVSGAAFLLVGVPALCPSPVHPDLRVRLLAVATGTCQCIGGGGGGQQHSSEDPRIIALGGGGGSGIGGGP
jgi:hypothetical protein